MLDSLRHHVLHSIIQHCFKSYFMQACFMQAYCKGDLKSDLTGYKCSSSRNVGQYLELAMHTASSDPAKFISSGSVPCWGSEMAPVTALAWQPCCSVRTAAFCLSYQTRQGLTWPRIAALVDLQPG